MRRFGVLRAVKFAVMGLVAVTLVSLVVMALWNAVMPAVFDLKPITFWQTVGLLILSKILFGGFRGRPGAGMHWRRRMLERWDQMTPEEREKFRQGMRHRCGGSPSPEAGVQA
jgi:hypothetical protein